MNALIDLVAPFVFVVVLTSLLFFWMPRLTRPDLYFAITVKPGFRDSEQGRALLSQYRFKVVAASLVATGVVALGGFRSSLALLIAGLIVQEAGALFAYFAARAQVKPHAVEPTAVREAALSLRRQGLPGGWLAQAGPFALLAAAAVYLQLHWSAIPERFPIHWGLNGQPNGWATRTVTGVYGPLLIAAAICAMLGGLAYGVLRGSRPIRIGGPSGQAEAGFRSTVAAVLVGAEYLMAIVFTWTALALLTHPGSESPQGWEILVLTLVFMIATVALLVRLGQGGTRAVQVSVAAAAEDRQPVGDRTRDRYWKAGLLYVNSEDPAIFVEKRFGIGYTVNFGRPASWLMLAGLVLLPLVIALVVKWGS